MQTGKHPPTLRQTERGVLILALTNLYSSPATILSCPRTLVTHTNTHAHRQIVAISGWMAAPRQELLPAFVTELINHCTHWGNDPLRERNRTRERER